MNNLFSHVPVRDNRMLERYFNLIEHYVDNPYNGKGEKHHTLPASLGGKDSPLVLLPHRAHYVAHHMLWRAIGGKMAKAFHLMAHNKRYPDSRITARVFAVLKEENAKQMSEVHKGKVTSAETRKKISEGMTGEKNHRYGKTMSAEHKKKIGESNTGKKRSAEAKKNMSECRIGVKRGKYKI